jgi:hypothetical protein
MATKCFDFSVLFRFVSFAIFVAVVVPGDDGQLSSVVEAF